MPGRDPQEKIPCKGCDGTGICWLCTGTGENLKGVVCPACYGGKKCRTCKGRKTVERFEQEGS